MSLEVYFHLYAAGAWEQATEEFLDAMCESGLDEQVGTLRLGIVGFSADRQRALRYCRSRVAVEVVAEAETGWEQLTLAVVAQSSAGAVGYFHTKGAAVGSAWNISWRRSMYRALVWEWRDCVPELAAHPAVGCHFLEPRHYAIMPQRHPFFAGNCWWARGELVRALPPCQMNSRYDAECWIGVNGLNDVVDRTPGWPSPQSIRQEVAVPILGFRVPPMASEVA